MNLKKQFGPLTLQMFWTEDAAAMLAQHNYNTTNLGNLELIFLTN